MNTRTATKFQIQIRSGLTKKEWQTTRTFQTQQAAEAAAAKVRIATDWDVRVIEK